MGKQLQARTLNVSERKFMIHCLHLSRTATDNHRYDLAGRLSERLDEMGKDLSGMIEEINAASSTLNKNNNKDDPVRTALHVKRLTALTLNLAITSRSGSEPASSPTSGNRSGRDFADAESSGSSESSENVETLEWTWVAYRCCEQ